MGGFRLIASKALAKRVLRLAGCTGDVTAGACSIAGLASATEWHIWQATQVSQCALGETSATSVESGERSRAPGSLASCPAQGTWVARFTVIMPTAITSPAQARRGNKAIMRMRNRRRMVRWTVYTRQSSARRIGAEISRWLAASVWFERVWRPQTRQTGFRRTAGRLLR